MLDVVSDQAAGTVVTLRRRVISRWIWFQRMLNPTCRLVAQRVGFVGTCVGGGVVQNKCKPRIWGGHLRASYFGPDEVALREANVDF